MRVKSFLTIVIAIAFCLTSHAQLGMDLGEMAMQQAGLTGGGITFIEDENGNRNPYFRTQLQPEAKFGKIGLGLDLVFLIGNVKDENGEEKISVLGENGEKWNNASSLLRSVRYIRYAQPADPLYAHFGELDYVTIGHGFIMSGYANHDRRGLRFNARFKEKFGFESVINDLGEPSVFGGRVYFRPISRIEIGATYLTDTSPDLFADSETPLQAIGFDLGVPILNSDLLKIDLYDDIAFLNTKLKRDEETGEIVSNEDGSVDREIAWGNAAGIAIGADRLKTLFKLEYRIFGDDFYPTIFDYTYDVSPPDFLGMDDQKNTDGKRGFFGLFNSQIIPKVNMIGTFESYSDSDPRLYFGITESGLLEKLSFRAFYTKRNIGQPYFEKTFDEDGNFKSEEEVDPGFFEDLFRLDQKSAFTVRIGYELISSGIPLEFGIVQQWTFQKVERDDKFVFEPIKNTSFEIGVKLQFE